MSTTIYNAYKFTGKDPYTLLNILKDYRDRYQEDMINTLSKFTKLDFTPKYYKFLERAYTMTDLSETSLGSFMLAKIIKEEIEIGMYSPLNIDASCVIYPYDGEIYIQFFGLHEKFISTRFFTDYHYQDQSDISNYDEDTEPWDEMTINRQYELDADWENRKKLWDKVLGYTYVPSDNGFLFNFHPTGSNLSVFCNDVLDKIKPIEDEDN